MGLSDAPSGSLSIADLGGTLSYWRAFEPDLPDSIGQITIISPDESPGDYGRLVVHCGDATRLDEFDDGAFDIVHSNSVIEHVGDWDAMRRMASHVERLAPHYFVQTPYFWFPVEPHFRRIGFQLLPRDTVARKMLARPYGFYDRPADYAEAIRVAESNNLLNIRQMRSLFPAADIHKERFLGLVKSLIAIR